MLGPAAVWCRRPFWSPSALFGLDPEWSGWRITPLDYVGGAPWEACSCMGNGPLRPESHSPIKSSPWWRIDFWRPCAALLCVSSTYDSCQRRVHHSPPTSAVAARCHRRAPRALRVLEGPFASWTRLSPRSSRSWAGAAGKLTWCCSSRTRSSPREQ